MGFARGQHELNGSQCAHRPFDTTGFTVGYLTVLMLANSMNSICFLYWEVLCICRNLFAVSLQGCC